ncbi:uncharacterized protein LOC26535581 [Drosophila yakuba]|uniref:Uncharacterized protein n=1 Tax=Drosophila yakuba TaxID=7245 RepID=A0A0R1EBX8_DROYA|nr:uncharacterized protein LOC26535581 [Drosophila yakuba]KRK06939.1 uncharacterized protein Dyak_GE28400 [Drosophila yakuba]
MTVFQSKNRPSWQLQLCELPRKGPGLILRYYKHKPAFRPTSENPITRKRDRVMSKLQDTRNKLLGLMQRFEKVDNIVEGSRRRRNPFHLVASMAMAYEDIETHMIDGILGWSDLEETDDCFRM